MDDLATFLSHHPHLSPDVLRRIELFRARVDLEVRQTVERVRTRKLSPYTGADMGARLSTRAVHEIEDTVIAFCSKLFKIVAAEYQEVPGIAGDLTALFEELAGSTLVEAHRLYRNATAGMWFESVPSLRDLRLHKARGDKTPYDEIADYTDPEPSSIRVADVLVSRIERLREDVTTAAMRQRVEHLMNTPLEAETFEPHSGTVEMESAPAEARGDAADCGRQSERGQEQPSHPNRASWLQDRLTERAWNPNDPARHCGPDRKTIRKILSGGEVREDVLEKLVGALSKKHGKVSLTDIPRD